MPFGRNMLSVILFFHIKKSVFIYIIFALYAFPTEKINKYLNEKSLFFTVITKLIYFHCLIYKKFFFNSFELKARKMKKKHKLFICELK